MTHSEDIPQQADLDLGPSSGGVTAETSGAAEPSEEGVTADYQTRLREFDEVESVPVVSVPVQSSELEDSDLRVQAPGSHSE